MRKARRIDEAAYAKLLNEILPRPIRTEAENEKAVALLDEIDQLEKPAPEEALLAELLTILVEDFESKHYSLQPSEPRRGDGKQEFLRPSRARILLDRYPGFRLMAPPWATVRRRVAA